MNAYTTVDFIAGPPATITVIATPNNLSADSKSTSTIRAEVKDAHGNAVANGETISFSVIQGTGTLSPSTAKTSDGIATVTYTASAAPGAEIVEAEATNGVSIPYWPTDCKH
jgi:adhesin/invasin